MVGRLTPSHRFAVFMGAIVTAALLTTACSGKPEAPAAPKAATTAATASATASPTPTASATPVVTTIRVGTAGAAGSVLVDSKGMTLYTFKNDVAGSGKSVCNGTCATNWPPLKVTAGTPTKGAGIAGDVGVVTRDDGTTQVSYKGLPLYYFAQDQVAGDAKGAAVNNWAVAAP